MTRPALVRIGQGALLCVVLAGFLGASAHAAPAKKRSRAASRSVATSASANDSNQVLVRIGKDVITRGDVQRRIESLPEQFRSTYATPEGRQQLLDRMVEEKVWLSLAVKNGVADRPQVKSQLEQQRRDLLVRTYLNEVMATNAAPSDSEARLYYESHPSEFQDPATVTVKHIQTKTEAEAKRVLQFAKGKTKWDDLAKRYSADTLTRANGGNLGTITREGVFNSIGSQPALAEAAFTLPDGGVGGPYKTDRGWHVIKVENKKEAGVRPFERVRQNIMRTMSAQRSQDFYKEKLDSARRTLGVHADSSAIKGFVSQKKSARDLFNEAQAITAPEARITAYRELLAQFPESDVSPQAQFMIGFIYSEELKNYDEAAVAFRELLRRYPKAELAASAEWMLAHMREENAPPFVQDGDNAAPGSIDAKNPAVTPATRRIKPWTPSRGDSTARQSQKGQLVKP